MNSSTVQNLAEGGKTLPTVKASAWQDLWIAAGLFVLGILIRLPFTEQIFYHWDSINFAMSLRQFNVWLGQPQVPGYILFVALAQLVNRLTGDAQTTLVGISLVSGALAVAFLYLLGRDMFSRTVGLIAALFLASSPLFWFYGEVALPHTLDALVVIVFVWMVYRILQGEFRLAIPAAIWLGLAGGLRPQTEMFLAPLAVYAGWRLGWKRGLLAGVILALVDFAWFIPLVILTGGLSRYFFVMRQFSAAFDSTTSVLSGAGLFGLQRNATKLAMYTIYGWGLASIPAGLAALKILAVDRKRVFSFQKPGWLSDPRLWVILLWLLPATGFYLLVHMGQQGLTFVFLPVLLLVSAAGAVYILRERVFLNRLVVAGLILINSAIFLIAPTFPLGANGVKILTADTIRAQDRFYQLRFQAILKQFPAQNTILISSAWRFPQYYLPNYVFMPYTIVSKWEEGEGQPANILPDYVDPKLTGGAPNGSGLYYSKRPDTVDPSAYQLRADSSGSFYLVLLDNDLLPYYQGVESLQTLVLPDGSKLAYVRFSPQERVHFGPNSFGIVPAVVQAK